MHGDIVQEGQVDRAEAVGGADEEELRALLLDVLVDRYLVYVLLTFLLLSFAYLVMRKKTDNRVT